MPYQNQNNQIDNIVLAISMLLCMAAVADEHGV